MAKAPVAGAVKTRLVPPLTASEAAALNICFLRDMTANIADVAEVGDADGFVVYAPIGAESVFEGILPNEFKLLAQRGDSLGDRLCNATDDLLNNGYGTVCLINSDSPTLPRVLLERAVHLLAEPGDRLVLGAADDGGYYLIGLKQAHRNLFERITWSTAEVLAHTIERAEEIGLRVELLPRWYDVDDATTLQRLCDELFVTNRRDGAYPAPHTKAFLDSIIEKEGPHRLCSKTRSCAMTR
jgi:rSAM/selenodomain-associated transferase 1